MGHRVAAEGGRGWRTVASALVAILGLALGGNGWAVKAAPPLEADLRLQLPPEFPGAATATFLAHSAIAGGTLALSLAAPQSYLWISGATQLAPAALPAGTYTLSVGFFITSPTHEPIVGAATLEAEGGLRVQRSLSIPLLPPPEEGDSSSSPPAPGERDGALLYPGRTRVR